MIDIDTLENEIIDLEKRDTTFATIERLAWLYVVKDHLNESNRNKQTGNYNGSEFKEVCSGVPMEALMDVLSEHFDLIQALYPKEYALLISKIKEL